MISIIVPYLSSLEGKKTKGWGLQEERPRGETKQAVLEE